MNEKEHITQLEAQMSAKAITEFHIQYNACFTRNEQMRLIREYIAALIKKDNKDNKDQW